MMPMVKDKPSSVLGILLHDMHSPLFFSFHDIFLSCRDKSARLENVIPPCSFFPFICQLHSPIIVLCNGREGGRGGGGGGRKEGINLFFCFF